MAIVVATATAIPSALAWFEPQARDAPRLPRHRTGWTFKTEVMNEACAGGAGLEEQGQLEPSLESKSSQPRTW